ncbi:MAG TPA: right-handed parallel beta-helix repeat-containing protein [Candidatus Saccharimonadales bacterium]
MSRLPTPGQDNGTWGAILNDYLSQSHTSDGSLKSGVVGPSHIQDGVLPKSKLDPTVQASLTKADSALQSAPVSSVVGLTGAVTGAQIAADSALGAAYQSKVAGVINVKDYGAKGDGATNDTTAINNAIAALVAGYTLYFPPGRYLTNGGHVIDKPSCLIKGSSGRAQTYNSSAQLYLRNGANADMLTLANNQITVRDLSLYGNKTNQTGTSRGLVTPSTAGANYLLLDAVWVDSFNGDGFSFESSGGTLSGTITNCESRVNNGYGMYFYGTSTDTMVSNCYIDQNVQSGIMCSSGDLSLTSCHIWGNGTGSTGNLDGITFQSSAGCRVINCYIETQTNGTGIRFKSGTNKGHIVSGCDIWSNGQQGIYAYSASNCTISGNIIRQNNYKGLSGASGAGLIVDTCTAITITGNQFFSSGVNRQTYGYYEYGSSNTNIQFVGNMSRAADHTTGGVFLGPGTNADLGSAFMRKTTDQSVTSSIALVDDASLQFTVAAGEVWELDGVLFAEGSQAGDLSLQINVPSGMSGYWQALGPDSSATSTSADTIAPTGHVFNSTATLGMLGAGTVVPIQVRGLLTVGTAGAAKVQFAQAVSDGTATILHGGSYLRAKRVAQ